MVFKIVDLPAPFAPSIVTSCPSFTSRETPCKAFTFP
ncbi:uncharacterized protein METZ01_LOCUS125743 [marine metagenome]|uniref:Uncharacterized protein n=1 Tax=marine metagenome TaxID=408172 RepID=A0A381Y734_9ZZZZ